MAGPAAYALDTVNTAHTGAIPSAGRRRSGSAAAGRAGSRVRDRAVRARAGPRAARSQGGRQGSSVAPEEPAERRPAPELAGRAERVPPVEERVAPAERVAVSAGTRRSAARW